MAGSDQLLQRQHEPQATRAHKEASIIARHQVYVITFLHPGLNRQLRTGQRAGSQVHRSPRLLLVHTVRADAERLRSGTVLLNTTSISGHVDQVTTGSWSRTGEWVLMSAQESTC